MEVQVIWKWRYITWRDATLREKGNGYHKYNVLILKQFFHYFHFDFFFYVLRLIFSDLPEVKTVTVQIYKEADGKNRKEKRKPIG